jgi:hypothetical protein
VLAFFRLHLLLVLLRETWFRVKISTRAVSIVSGYAPLLRDPVGGEGNKGRATARAGTARKPKAAFSRARAAKSAAGGPPARHGRTRPLTKFVSPRLTKIDIPASLCHSELYWDCTVGVPGNSGAPFQNRDGREGRRREAGCIQ